MSQWEMVKLGEVCELRNGRAYKQTELLDEGKYPVLRVGNFFSNKGWYYSDLELDDNKYCDCGDLLFAWSASFGPKIWDGNKVIFHYHIWRIDLLDTLNKNYMYYVLLNKSEKIKAAGRGIAMIHTTKGEMEEMKIPLPPLETQQRMAKTLDLVSGIIEGYRQKLTELDKLVQSVFYEMFGDPVENEMGWVKIEFSQVLHSIESGKSFVCNNEPRTGENPAILKLSAISSGVFVHNENKSMIDTNDFVEKREVHQGDLLFSRKNTPELVGISAFVIKSEAKLMLPDLIFRLITKDNCDKIYLWKLINHPLFRPEVRNLANGSSKSMCNISMENLKKLKIPLPPLPRQEQFAHIVEKIEEEKALVQEGLREAEQLFGGLLQEYFQEY